MARWLAWIFGMVALVVLSICAVFWYFATHFVNPIGRLVELDETVAVRPFLERCDSLARVSRLYPDSSYIRSLRVEYLSEHRVVYLDCDTNAIAVVDFVAGYPMIFRLDYLNTGRTLTGKSKISPADKELIKQKLIRFVNAVKKGEPCP